MGASPTIMKPSMAVLLLALAALACSAAAQDALATVDSTGPAGSAGPSKDVSVFSVFPFNEGRQFEIGEVGEVFLGFQNRHKSYVNVTYLHGALYHPSDATRYVQNFTRALYGISVPAGVEVSVDYYFRPDAMLEPMTAGFFATVEYTDGISNFTHTFFNGTVELVQPPASAFDAQSLFLFVGFAAAIGVGGYALMNQKKSESKGAAAPAERGTSSKIRTDFLPDAIRKSKGKKKGKGKR